MAFVPASNVRPGLEAEARRFWDEEFFDTFRRIAYRYGIDPDASYPFYEIRRDHVLSWLAACRPGRVLDIGCGGGHVMEALLDRGWNAAGCDFSPRMVAFAKQRLADAGWPDAIVAEHCATDLSAYADEAFDAVLCLGPLEYLSVDETQRAYAEMRRVLTSGGQLLCAHINALFDLFTLDGFTAVFVSRLLAETYEITGNARQRLNEALRQLCDSKSDGEAARSLRARVSTRADNPLTVGDDLARSGFTLKDQRFYRFYTAPPAVMRQLNLPNASAIEHERRLCGGWPGHLLASSFLTCSVKR